jgi:hypothetical protein
MITIYDRVSVAESTNDRIAESLVGIGTPDWCWPMLPLGYLIALSPDEVEGAQKVEYLLS